MNITLLCLADANPAVAQIAWQMNGIPVNATHNAIIGNNSLTMTGISRQQTGKYSCSSSNEVGESSSKEYHIRVLCE